MGELLKKVRIFVHERSIPTVSDHIKKLEHLQSLKDKGTLTEEEFQTEKAKILSDEPTIPIIPKPVAATVPITKESKAFRNIMIAVAAIVLIYIFANRSPSGGSEGIPSYVKTVTAYKEGDGLVIYFILADNSGTMISSSGTAALKIYKGGSPIYDININVKGSDFANTEIGMGAFKRDALIFSFGRIPFSSLGFPSEGTGRITLDFTHNGQTVSGNETVFF